MPRNTPSKRDSSDNSFSEELIARLSKVKLESLDNNKIKLQGANQKGPPGLSLTLLNISKSEWAKAIKHFEKFPTCKKLKKFQGLEHSFIKVNDKLFAMANRQLPTEIQYSSLGEGTWGKVKVVQTIHGANYAVKIEARGLRDPLEPELLVMQKINYYFGELHITFPEKLFKNELTTQKLYTITELKEGIDLYEHLYSALTPLDEVQKLLIGLQLCLIIHFLHSQNILHLDIKPENIIAKISSYDIKVGIVDFGLSTILKPYEKAIIAEERLGTIGYIAPEINFGENLTLTYKAPVQRIYSFASDVWAIARILSSDLQLPEIIWRKAIDSNWRQRARLTQVIDNIVTELGKHSYLSEVKSSISLAKKKLLLPKTVLMPVFNHSGNISPDTLKSTLIPPIKPTFLPLFRTKKSSGSTNKGELKQSIRVAPSKVCSIEKNKNEENQSGCEYDSKNISFKFI